MSDTPRTDSAMKYCFGSDEEFIKPSIARQLERELNAAKDGIANLHKQFEDVSADIDRLDDVYTKLAAANERVKRLEECFRSRLEHAQKRYDEEQADGDNISIASTRASYCAFRDVCDEFRKSKEATR